MPITAPVGANSAKRRPGQQGMALLAVIIFITIIAMMGAAITSMHQGTVRSSGETIAGTQAFLLSDSAAELARAQLIGANCTPGAVSGALVAGNITTVNRSVVGSGNLTISYLDYGNNTYRITTSGVPTAAGAPNQRGSIFEFICIPGSGGNGTGDVVDLLTGSPSEDYVFNNTAVVMPSLHPSSFPTFASGGNLSASGTVSGSGGPYGVVSTGNNANVTLSASGGDFNAKDLNVGQNGVITLTPGNYTFSGNVTLGNNARIVIDPPGSVNISVLNSFSANQNSSINANAAGQLTVQMYGTNSSFNLDQNAAFKGVVAAPGNQTSVNFDQNVRTEAAILTGGNVSIDQNVQFNGTILANHAITVDQNANVSGALAANGNITLRQNVKLTGGVDAGGIFSSAANANITLRNPTPKPSWFASWSGGSGGGGAAASASTVNGTWKEDLR